MEHFLKCKLEAIHKTYLPCAHVQLWLLADASHIHSHLLFVLTRPMKLFPLSTDLPIVDFTYNQSCIIWEPSFLAFFFSQPHVHVLLILWSLSGLHSSSLLNNLSPYVLSYCLSCPYPVRCKSCSYKHPCHFFCTDEL